MCVNQSEFQSHAEPMQSTEQQTQISIAKALKMKVLVEPLLREDETELSFQSWLGRLPAKTNKRKNSPENLH